MKNIEDKELAVVNVHFKLAHPVPERLYNYIEEKLSEADVGPA